MEDETLAVAVANEKRRILALKREYEQKIKDIQEKLNALDRRMEATLDYERAVSGSRSLSDDRRAHILRLIQAQPGIRRKAICESLGVDVRSNKAQNVSIALTKLVREGEIHRDGSRAYYPLS